MLTTLHHPDGRIANVEPFQIAEFTAAGFTEPGKKQRKSRATGTAPSTAADAAGDDATDAIADADQIDAAHPV